MPTEPHDQDLATATIAAGLRWLYDTEQIDDGVLHQHLGIGHRVADRFYRFVPDHAGCVIVMDVADTAIRYNRHNELDNPLTDHDVATFEQTLTALGHTPIDRWNGAGSITVSVRLQRPAHPSLLAAVDRYRRGCPVHNSVFCTHDHDCRWFRDTDLIRPAWPDSPQVQPTGTAKTGGPR